MFEAFPNGKNFVSFSAYFIGFYNAYYLRFVVDGVVFTNIWSFMYMQIDFSRSRKSAEDILRTI